MHLKEKLFNKITIWKSKLLSEVDRTTLIRAVFATVLAYPLSFLFMPEFVHKELDKAMKDFWWDFHLEKENKLPSKSWHQICTPKFVGGLGLIMMHDVNLVLVAKLVWKFLTHHDSLLVKLLKAKYLKREDLWSALAGAKQSWIWKAILNWREIVKEGLCSLVGNGLNIYVWKQPWIPYLPSFKPQPLEPTMPRGSELKVFDLILQNQRGWDVPKLMELFD